jgi:iron complex outermembrane recepter protein
MANWNNRSVMSRLLASTPLSLATVAALSYAGTAQAQAVDEVAAEAGEEAAIVVTGSRIAREGFDASTPVSVVDADDFKLAGTVNVEEVLSESPQFVASTNGGATANTVPGGTADLNLRGFGASRNLVLVNGRRFAISGPEGVTDINTIPAALIARTEIVTGGSSAVYGSDAITGVVNFIMRNDFDGLEARSQIGLDSSTKTLNKSFDVTAGGNFAGGRGNAVVSVNYMTRGAITRGERGGFTFDSLSDGCVTAASASPRGAGIPLVVPSGQTCRQAGGVPGFVAGGSGDIPNSRISGLPAPGSSASNPALNAAYAAAGISGFGGFGITFNDAGSAVRPALDPQDRYNLGPDNYLIIPQERWMANAFAHYDITDNVTAYLEFHYSNNKVDAQLAPSNVGVSTLLNVTNPFLSTQMQEVLRQLDLRETGTTTVTSGSTSRTTVAGDGLAVLTLGKRYTEVGQRRADTRRNVFRTTVGFKGELGSASESFLKDLNYDAYYTYARTETTEKLANAISRSKLQASLLSVGTAAPVCNVFGQNVSEACANAIRISALNVTESELQVAAATVGGTFFDLPAGPVGFSLGVEWRKNKAVFQPDSFLSSGDVVGFNAGLPTGGQLSAKEVFGEIRVPILSNTPFFQDLSLNGAFRYSDYSLAGVGGVWTYLGGADWRISSDIALRAQYQRAIRAPNVGDLFGGLRRSVEPATDPCSSRQPTAGQTAAVRALCVAAGVPTAQVFTLGVQPNTIIPADFGGNPNVGEERSDTYTAGVVLTPSFIPGFRLSVDYFNIKLDGAIAQLGGGLNNTLNLCYNVIQDINSEFCQAIRRDASTGAITDSNAAQIRQANTGALETSGIDVALRHSFDLGFGIGGLGEKTTLEISSDWTWTEKFTSTPVQAFPNIKNRCVGSFGATCGEPIAEWRGSSRVTLDAGKASLSLRHRYISGVTTDRYLLPLRAGATPPALADISYPKLKAVNYFDLSFTIDPVENFQFFGGARNIFNTKPPVVGSPQVRANTYPATYDVLGTEFFFGGSVKF